MSRKRIVILGAAGRDFHDFNVAFREDPATEVVAFTAAQIPSIDARCYPSSLAGKLYPEGIPIHPQSELEALLDRHRVDEVVLSYSDLSHEDVMHLASRALAKGAGFRLLGPKATMLPARKPVISVCAVRTGCGKSPLTRLLAELVRRAGRRPGLVRHPMPYGDLARQAVQRFATLDDLDRQRCTIEEMEEYEPHLRRGDVVYAGVDYERILRLAEAEADVLLWDGGNNDASFFRPDLEIVVLDPHRAGHETRYHPGETNLRRAQILVINKVDSAEPAQVEQVRRAARAANPGALIVETAMPVRVHDPGLLRGRRVLVVEDGPTLTHGGMSFGAGVLAVRAHGAELADPRPHAVGSLRDTYRQHPHLGAVLPAMGYGADQVRDLEATIRATPADAVLIATPVDLRRLMAIDRPCARASYDVEEVGGRALETAVHDFLKKAVAHG